MRAIIAILIGSSLLSAGDPDPEALMQNGHWKRARDAAEAAYRAHPQDARANYWLARVRDRFGEHEEALKYAEQAVQLDPKNASYHRELADVYGNIGLKSSVFKQVGLARKCRTELDAASTMNPKDVDNLEAQMVYYLEAPGIVGGDKKKALAIADEMTKLNPARGYLAQADIARKEKEEGKLEQLYQKAVEADPRNYGALVALANYYLGAQHTNLNLAEKYAAEALKVNPDRVTAYVLLVHVFQKQNRGGEVASMLAKAEAAVPDNLAPYLTAGRDLLQQGSDLQTAESYLRKYLTQPPENGWPPHAGAHWSIGLLYEKRGDKAQARAEMETALRLKPDFEPARKDLKRLK
jgi:tetratricopeptide (TPR) repeat protein